MKIIIWPKFIFRNCSFFYLVWLRQEKKNHMMMAIDRRKTNKNENKTHIECRLRTYERRLSMMVMEQPNKIACESSTLYYRQFVRFHNRTHHFLYIYIRFQWCTVSHVPYSQCWFYFSFFFRFVYKRFRKLFPKHSLYCR